MKLLPKKLEYHGGPIHDDVVVGDLVSRYNQLIDYLSDKEEDNLACCGGRVTEKDLEEYLSKDKEASKGEGEKYCSYCGVINSEDALHGYLCKVKYPERTKPYKFTPPQQEESRGEREYERLFSKLMADLYEKFQNKETAMFEEREVEGEPGIVQVSLATWVRDAFKQIHDCAIKLDPQLKEECRCDKESLAVKEYCPIHDNPVRFTKKAKGVYKESVPEEESPKEDEFQSVRNLLRVVLNQGEIETLVDHLKANFVSKVKIKNICEEEIKNRLSGKPDLFDAGARNFAYKILEGLEEL